MITFIEYILNQKEKYNLDDAEQELFETIVEIGKNKIKVLFG